MTNSYDAMSASLVGDESPSSTMAARYRDIRSFSERLAEPLSPEDCCIQSMPDVSPTKWHLAHTSWFFETFLLSGQPGYEPFDPQFRELFNSYYNGVGKQFPRLHRGLLSRPSLADVLYYRQYVDEALLKRLDTDEVDHRTKQVLEIGLHHEQQHQELILTDVKHVLAQNPLQPVYREAEAASDDRLPLDACGSVAQNVHTARRNRKRSSQSHQTSEAGLYEIGHAGIGFAYDNEGPRHRVFLEDFALATSTVTCGEWLQFIEDGGYEDPRLWLSLGWSALQQHQWSAPLYWFRRDDAWWQFTLAGVRPVDPEEPVCHVSYYEADAFARWAGSRLPSEAEWEVAAADQPMSGNFVDVLLKHDRPLHPHCTIVSSVPSAESPSHGSKTCATGMFGNVWEWTASPYTPYPGYAPPKGALGEYNGKFMSQQYVLRGGSVATHSTHIRPTYRNFFPPEARWQFSGLRLAR